MGDIVGGKYPGRALFFGKMNNDAGTHTVLYEVGGRSPGSKARVLKDFESSTTPSPFKIIRTMPLEGEEDFIHNYNAMMFNRDAGYVVVSNGIQTDNIMSMLETQISQKSYTRIHENSLVRKGIEDSLNYGLGAWGAEPDHPNYTARIGGVGWGNFVSLGLIVHEAKWPRIYSFNMGDILNPGDFVGVSTYDKDTPNADLPDYLTSDIGGDLWGIKLESDNLSHLTKEFYDLMEQNKVKYKNGREETTLVGVAAMTFRGDFGIANVADQDEKILM